MTEGFRVLDFDAYHREELPRLLAQGREASAAEEAALRGSLAIRVDSGVHLANPGGAPRDRARMLRPRRWLAWTGSRGRGSSTISSRRRAWSTRAVRESCTET